MIKIEARNLLNFSTQQLWDGLDGEFILVFEDGELVTNERETIYSAYFWEYHRRYPNVKLSVRHHVRSVMKRGEPTANMAKSLTENIYWDVYRENEKLFPDPSNLIDRLSKMAYEIPNTVYNEFSLKMEPYVTSLDILDFLAFTEAPDISSALSELESSEAGMETAQRILLNAVENDARFKRNPLAVAVRTGISRVGQAMQMLGARGYLTDIDSHIFPYPIRTSYTRGIRTLYDNMIESRSAAKSLFSAEAPLKNSEYFSRRQQLIGQNVRHLHFCDCGSTNYLHWRVRDARKDGLVNYRSDLETLQGKYYMDDDETLKVIGKNDKHLIGRVLRLRSPIAGCAHSDPYGICMVCYGQAGLGIPAHSNLGQVCSTSLMAIISQLILSTKHFDGSSTVEGIILNNHDKAYLHAETNGSEYYLNPRLKTKAKVTLRIPSKFLPGLSDVTLVDDVRKLNLTRTSEFQHVGFVIEENDEVICPSVPVFVNNRNSSLSHDFLEYVRKNGFTLGPNNTYEFDMGEWDCSKPMFVLPMSHFNMSDFQRAVENLLEMPEDEAFRTQVRTPEDLILQLHDLINRRLEVNLSVLEVVAYATMIIDEDEGLYSLPKSYTKRNVGAMKAIMNNRSLSVQMAFEGHRRALLNPANFVQTNRMDHLYDGLMMHELFNR